MPQLSVRLSIPSWKIGKLAAGLPVPSIGAGMMEGMNKITTDV